MNKVLLFLGRILSGDQKVASRAVDRGYCLDCIIVSNVWNLLEAPPKNTYLNTTISNDFYRVEVRQ